MNNVEKEFLIEILEVLRSGRAHLAGEMLGIFLGREEAKVEQPLPDEPSKA